MSRYHWPLMLWAVVLVGLLLRLLVFMEMGGQYHADELFQYLEPAFWKINGYGFLTWEYESGARNWSYSGFNYLLMQCADVLGLRSQSMLSFVWIHNAVISLVIIPAGWRIGLVVGRGDKYAALLMASCFSFSPLIVFYSLRSFSELPCMITIVWAYTLWIEESFEPKQHIKSALVMGALLGAAFVFRYAAVMFIGVVFLDFLIRRKFRVLVLVTLGFCIPVLITAAADYLAWGGFFHSFVEFVDYNVVRDKAKTWGTESPLFYFKTLVWDTFGYFSLVFIVLVVASLRHSWRLTMAWLLGFIAHSAIAHKEIRFLAPVFPAMMASIIAGGWAIYEIIKDRHPRTISPYPVFAIVMALSLWMYSSNWVEIRQWPWRFHAGYYQAQQWVGKQEDATGLIVEATRTHTGGYSVIDRNIPLEYYNPKWFGKRLFNYYIVERKEPIHLLLGDSRFTKVKRFEGVVVFKRAQ